MIFQQDGAPPHYANVVRDALNEKLPGRWMGRRGPIEWPARSPDLSPLDFFLWGYIKDKVYQTRLKSIDELKRAVLREIRKLDGQKDLLKRVCASVTARADQCIDNGGGHFECYR